jgi:hypothetical protein
MNLSLDELFDIEDEGQWDWFGIIRTNDSLDLPPDTLQDSMPTFLKRVSLARTVQTMKSISSARWKQGTKN